MLGFGFRLRDFSFSIVLHDGGFRVNELQNIILRGVMDALVARQSTFLALGSKLLKFRDGEQTLSPSKSDGLQSLQAIDSSDSSPPNNKV